MVISFKPKSRLLSKYIQAFNTFDKGCDLHINFATFPHVGPALALLKNARLEMKQSYMNITPTEENYFNTVVLGKYTSPVFITYNGYVDEISINFTPLGINYFFDSHYQKIAPQNFQHLTERDWIDFTPKLFSNNNIKEQLEFLENFLADKFRERHLDSLQHSVDLFMDIDADYRVGDVAKKAGINEKTMRRQFCQFVGCPPILFKRIVRFRNAINIKRLNDQSHNLTRLSHEGIFYDSSHFVREYKLLSGRNPKSFFKNVAFLGNNKYPYISL